MYNWLQSILEHTQSSLPNWSEFQSLDFHNLGLMTSGSKILSHKEGWVVYFSVALSLLSLVAATYVVLKENFCKNCPSKFVRCSGFNTTKFRESGTQTVVSNASLENTDGLENTEPMPRVL